MTMLLYMYWRNIFFLPTGYPVKFHKKPHYGDCYQNVKQRLRYLLTHVE